MKDREIGMKTTQGEVCMYMHVHICVFLKGLEFHPLSFLREGLM